MKLILLTVVIVAIAMLLLLSARKMISHKHHAVAHPENQSFKDNKPKKK